MHHIFGIVSSTGKNAYVEGMQKYRPIGAFSFLGRYRIIDFPISNFSNSDIDRIQIYVGESPRSLIEHVGRGRHYNINSKSGRLHLLFHDDETERNYQTDIANYFYNLEYIERMHHEYVIIAPSNMIYSADFRLLLQAHLETNADITLLYHNVDNANINYLNCSCLNLDGQKKVTSIETNHGNAKSRSIFMETYIMEKELFIQLIKDACKTSSMYTLENIVNDSCTRLNIRGIAHRGFFAAITDFHSYFETNLELTNIRTAKTLFDPEWPIYTRTNDSCPTGYHESSHVQSSVIANGCTIEGTVENSVLGRGCIIKKGAVVKNSILLARSYVSENTIVENQVIDKSAKLLHIKEVVSPPDHPGYIKKNDII